MVALAMLGIIAGLAFLGWIGGQNEGCAESRIALPKPTCNLGKPPTSPRAVVADLIRLDPHWLLVRDDDDGALVMTTLRSVFVFPPTETRTPEAALATFLSALPPVTQTAVRRTKIVLVWLGRTHDTTGEGVRYPGWDNALGKELFHDVVTPDGCLAREAPFDNVDAHVSRHHANEHLRLIAKFDAVLARALREGRHTPFSRHDSAAYLEDAAPVVRQIATVQTRETYAPISAIVIVSLIVLFYWWAGTAGKDSIWELDTDELRGDGALIAPGRFDMRVLSHGLLHANLKHLVNNAFALWIGCIVLEPAIGSARTLLIFLAGVVGGAVARLRLKRPGIMIGASGGAFALQAAALMLLLRPDLWFLADERSAFIIFLVVQLAFGLVASFLPGVSMTAHVGGALAGFVLTFTGLVLIGRPPLDGGPESALSAEIAWGIAGLAVVAWVAAGILVQRGRTDLQPDTGKQKDD